MSTLSVTLIGKTVRCASGVVLPDAVYQTNHLGAFNFMRDARLDYKPDIEQLSKDDHLSKMRGMKHIWAAGTDN